MPSMDPLMAPRAETAVKALHSHIINPSTSIATAILPPRMSDRLKLGHAVFTLKSFHRARKIALPDLTLISAALPVLYMQAEMMADAMASAVTTSGNSPPIDTEQKYMSSQPLASSAISVSKGQEKDDNTTHPILTDPAMREADGLPALLASTPQNDIVDVRAESKNDTPKVAAPTLMSLTPYVWDRICSFRGML